MKMKKILTTALAGAMALSLAAPAFAATTTGTVSRPLAESSESTFQVELEGMIYTPTIRVQVTESGSVYVNPSASIVAGTMTKALDAKDNLEYSFKNQTVVSTPILIRSDTDKALMVSATATATVPKTSGVVLAGATTGLSTATDKKVCLLVTGNGGTGLGDAATLQGRQDTTGGTAVNLPELDSDNAIAGGAPSSSNKEAAYLVADPAGGTSFKGTAAEAAKINAATQFTDSTGKVTSVTPQYGVVMISGETAGRCTTWAETDIVNVSVALTFGLAAD